MFQLTTRFLCATNNSFNMFCFPEDVIPPHCRPSIWSFSLLPFFHQNIFASNERFLVWPAWPLKGQRVRRTADQSRFGLRGLRYFSLSEILPQHGNTLMDFRESGYNTLAHNNVIYLVFNKTDGRCSHLGFTFFWFSTVVVVTWVKTCWSIQLQDTDHNKELERFTGYRSGVVSTWLTRGRLIFRKEQKFKVQIHWVCLHLCRHTP